MWAWPLSCRVWVDTVLAFPLLTHPIPVVSTWPRGEILKTNSNCRPARSMVGEAFLASPGEHPLQ